MYIGTKRKPTYENSPKLADSAIPHDKLCVTSIHRIGLLEIEAYFA